MTERISEERLAGFARGDTAVSSLFSGLELLDEVTEALISERAHTKKLEAAIRTALEMPCYDPSVYAILQAALGGEE